MLIAVKGGFRILSPIRIIVIWYVKLNKKELGFYEKRKNKGLRVFGEYIKLLSWRGEVEEEAKVEKLWRSEVQSME